MLLYVRFQVGGVVASDRLSCLSSWLVMHPPEVTEGRFILYCSITNDGKARDYEEYMVGVI